MLLFYFQICTNLSAFENKFSKCITLYSYLHTQISDFKDFILFVFKSLSLQVTN